MAKSIKQSKAKGLGKAASDWEDGPVERKPVPIHDLVAERAYGIWETEGRQDGMAERNWSRAEQELTGTAS